MNHIVLCENKYGQKIWVDTRESIGQAIIKKGIYYVFFIANLQRKNVCLWIFIRN
jgi:hypothetical protein